MAGLSLMAVPFSFDFGLQISSFCVIISTSKLVGFIGWGKSEFTPEVPQTSENFCPRSENGCGYMRSLKIWWNKQRLWELMPYHERLWETQRASQQWSPSRTKNPQKSGFDSVCGVLLIQKNVVKRGLRQIYDKWLFEHRSSFTTNACRKSRES